MADFLPRLGRAAAVAAWLVVFAVGGCGGGGSNTSSGGGANSPPANTLPPASITAMVGIDGGTVNGPDGVQVVIPAGALSKPTVIGISNDVNDVNHAIGATEIGGIKPISKVVAVTPHGTEFAESVRINLPFSPANVPVGRQPVIITSQPGGTWSALKSEVVGSMVSADISGFSYYAVGTCYTSRDQQVGGPDPTLACPSAGNFALRLQDGSGVELPVPRTPLGTALPAMTVTTPTRLQLNVEYDRPPGLGRGDLISVWAYGAGLTAAQQPLTNYSSPLGNVPTVSLEIDPARVPLAGRPGGVVIRVRGWVEYTTDAFYLGCLCFKPASWTYEAEVLVRVIYTAPITPPPPPVATYSVGGTVSGLTGTGLVLGNNGAGNLVVAANATTFAFAAPVNAGSAYNVTVLTQPAGQTCSVQNGSGTASANVGNVAVSCAAVVAGAKAWQGASLLETLDVGEALEPQVTFDSNGNGMAVWAQNDGTGFFKIQSRRYTLSSGWGQVMPVSNTPGVVARRPKIAVDGLGNLMAVWQQPINPTTITLWTNRYHPASGWGTATLLENNLNSAGGNNAEIAMDPSGNATVVWHESGGTWANLWARRYAAGGAWGAATLIENDNTGAAAGHRVVMDTAGNAMVVWVQSGFIQFNRYLVGSGWGSATPAHGVNARIAAEIDIALDSAGNMLMTWAQRDETSAHIIYSSRYASASWSAEPAIVHTTVNAAAKPSVAMDGNGNATVVWYEADATNAVSIWARRYTAAVGDAAVRIDDLSRYTIGGLPQTSMDASGNAVAVWLQGPHIWANRYVAGSGWAGATFIDSRAVVNGSSPPELAVDANGNAIAVWPHFGVSGPDIWGNVFR